jgi:hypothetical protein
MLADKRHDSDAIRRDLLDHSAAAEIPSKRNRKVQHSVSKRFTHCVDGSSASSGISRSSAGSPRATTRIATSFRGFVLLGCIRLRVSFVHGA